ARISPLVAEAFLKQKQAGQPAQKPGGRETRVAGWQGTASPARDFTNRIKIGGEIFDLVQEKKRKKAILDWDRLKKARDSFAGDEAGAFKGMLGVITIGSKRLMDGEKLETIIRIVQWLDPDEDIKLDWPRKKQFSVHDDLSGLVAVLDHVLQASYWKPKHPELGFVALFTNGDGSYWFRVSRGFHTALNESLASLESLVDEVAETATTEQKEKVSLLYRKLSAFFA
ncbi:MAG: hypothetical protein ABIJ86_02435, partial [Spirochaetota bacterium]